VTPAGAGDERGSDWSPFPSGPLRADCRVMTFPCLALFVFLPLVDLAILVRRP
jgi:hypothetical protein